MKSQSVESPLLENSRGPMYQAMEPSNGINNRLEELSKNVKENKDLSDDDSEDTGSVEDAKMWTNKEIKSFKEKIKKEDTNGIIKIGHGEILTIRVPTHPNGSYIFWEFATDNYDLGFGLCFEFSNNPGNQVSIHISESEDEDDEIEEEGNAENETTKSKSDPEKGVNKKPSEDALTMIVPIHRQDCHKEVYSGRHRYPGKGLYVLKFDNSYSLWRSKTLYYRVFYN